MSRRSCFKKWRFLVAFVMGLLCVVSCSDSRVAPSVPDYNISTPGELDSIMTLLKRDPGNLSLNITVLAYYTKQRNPEALIRFATPVFERADSLGNVRLMQYAGIYIAQTLALEKNSRQADYYLNKIEPLTWTTKDKFFKAMFYNVNGMYALKEEANYPEALSSFKKAYEIVKERGDSLNMCSLLCNISSIYNFRSDTAGYSYGEEAYEISRKISDHYAKFLGAYQMAQVCKIKKDYKKAMVYARETERYCDNTPLSLAQLYCLYGEIRTAEGNFAEAERCFQKAFSYMSDDNSDMPFEEVCLQYGEMLTEAGRLTEAVAMYEKGLQAGAGSTSMLYKHLFLRGLSELNDTLGNKDRALLYYKEYDRQYRQVFTLSKEQRFQELITENERISLQNEVQRKELELMESRTDTMIVAIVLSIIVVAFIVFYFVYRKQNRLYRRMVEYHQALLNQEVREEKKPSLAEPETPVSEQEPEEAATVAEESSVSRDEVRNRELWKRLSELMDKEHIYRQKDISLEKIAELLGTNRTYASNVLNQFSGDTFYNFIHKRRIKEASMRLSGPDGQSVSLKELAFDLGYNSLSSFYRAFQREIGCSPSKYREMVSRIERGEESEAE